jgi:UDP-glucose 4-epimerase
MRIVLTGGAGFIGSHIADRYAAAGHDVLVIDDLSSGRADQVPAGARLERLDVRDRRACEVLRAFAPDVLNLHAAQMDVRRSVADPVFDCEVNVLATVALLQAAVEAGTRRFLFASSGGTIYGDQLAFPAREDHPNQPTSPYGVSKLAGEKYLTCFAALHGVHTVALRYANVYGPRQNPHGEAGVVAIFCLRMLEAVAGKGDGPVVNGDGGQTRDFVYCEDVAAANLAALDCEFAGAVNIGTAVETDVSTVHDVLARSLRYARPRRHGEGKPGEQRRSSIDPGLAATVLRWRPSVTLEDGLARTADWFRARQGKQGS